MLGMNLPDNDAWTTALLTHPEVLAVNQDPGGKTARRISPPGAAPEIWIRKLADGASAVGFFNRGEQPLKYPVRWVDVGLRSSPAVRDLWLGEDLLKRRPLVLELPPHACRLFRVK